MSQQNVALSRGDLVYPPGWLNNLEGSSVESEGVLVYTKSFYSWSIFLATRQVPNSRFAGGSLEGCPDNYENWLLLYPSNF